MKVFKIMMALLTSQALIRSGEVEEYMNVLVEIFCMHQHSLLEVSAGSKLAILQKFARYVFLLFC